MNKYSLACFLLFSLCTQSASAFFAPQRSATTAIASEELERTTPNRSLLLGRVYDPLLGRFLSADVVVQFPNDAQSYNRYSYVRNNPLTKIDPTGFSEVVEDKNLGTVIVGPSGYITSISRGTPIEMHAMNLQLATDRGDKVAIAKYSFLLGAEATRLSGGGISPRQVINAAFNPEAGSKFSEAAIAGVAVAGDRTGARNPSEGNEVFSVRTNSRSGNPEADLNAAAPKTGLKAEIDTTAPATGGTANPRSLVSRQGPSEMNNNQVNRLTKDMKQNGFNPNKPIEVADVDGEKIIIQGHHRTEAAKAARIQEVPIKTITVTPEEAEKLAREAAEAAEERARLQRH